MEEENIFCKDFSRLVGEPEKLEKCLYKSLGPKDEISGRILFVKSPNFSRIMSVVGESL